MNTHPVEAAPVTGTTSGTPLGATTTTIGPGLGLVLVVFCLFGGLALSVDFPRAAFGWKSDEATYFMMGHSLARDGDLVYRREDLIRVWPEFPSGPSGVFLKRGSTVHAGVDGRVPFVHLQYQPDRDPARYYYGKSFMYPLIAAPFVMALGTNGFLLLHAILLALLTAAAYVFLVTRTRPALACTLAGAFVAASVAPVYFVWITPELFNLVVVTLGYFCWLYKEVADPLRAPRGARWLFRPSSDVVATLLIAVATCSKPSNAMLLVPVLIWCAWHRHWKRALVCTGVFAVLVGAFLAANIAISGEWNFQGGDRRTFYAAYPLQTPDANLAVGMDRTTNRPLWDIIFGPDFWTVFGRNLVYFFVGRYSGLVPYFFPAVFALVVFLTAPRTRPVWQWLVLAAAAGQILLFIITIPYNYFGGGGVVGNRYFMNAYGLFLFLVPAIHTWRAAIVPWIVGGLFSAQCVLNPFYTSFNPAEAATRGPLRLLPVELTLVNDLPININLSRVRRLFGEHPRFQLYFLDNNAFDPEGDSFWVRGESRAELLVKTADTVRTFAVTLAAGPIETETTVRIAGRSKTVVIAPGEIQRITLPLDQGFPYQGTRVWTASISSRRGFVSMFAEGGSDHRFLGVRVKPELMP